MLRRLIVGITGSAFSRNAVQTAMAYAKRHEAELVGVSVIDIARLTSAEPVPMGASAFKAHRDEKLIEDARRESDRLLSEFTAECAAQQIKGSAMQHKGEPAEVLAREAQRGDLLVLGRKGLPDEGSGSSNAIERLVRLAGRPILTVPAEGVPEGRPVLVAYDGSREAATALQAFQLLGLAAGRPIHVLHVAHENADHSPAELAADYLRLHGHEAFTHHEVSRNRVSDVIVEEASRLKAGVIVMGTCGRPRITEAIFGSVTRAVLPQSGTALFLHH